MEPLLSQSWRLCFPLSHQDLDERLTIQESSPKVPEKLKIDRVATAQGKQGIWLLTFPDRENTGNLVNLIFYTGKIVPTQGKF